MSPEQFEVDLRYTRHALADARQYVTDVDRTGAKARRIRDLLLRARHRMELWLSGAKTDNQSRLAAEYLREIASILSHKIGPASRREFPEQRDRGRPERDEDVYEDDYVLSRDYEDRWHVVRVGDRRAPIGIASSKASAVALAAKHARARGKFPVVIFQSTDFGGLQRIRTISRRDVSGRRDPSHKDERFPASAGPWLDLYFDTPRAAARIAKGVRQILGYRAIVDPGNPRKVTVNVKRQEIYDLMRRLKTSNRNAPYRYDAH